MSTTICGMVAPTLIDGSIVDVSVFMKETNPKLLVSRVGGPFIVTSYDYDVALDEYGLPNEPKYSHLAALHSVLHQYADLILSNPPSEGFVLDPIGQNIEIHNVVPIFRKECHR